MKKSHGLLLVLAVLCAAAGTLHFMHDKGLPGAIEEWTGGAPPLAPPPVEPKKTEPPPPEEKKPEVPPAPPPVVLPKRTNVKEMERAERVWMRGDLDLATAFFIAARAVSGDMDEREKAQKAIDRAILGWAVTERPDPVTVSGAKAEAQLAGMIAKAEASPSERGWFEALRFAASAHLLDRLPYLATNAVDTAARGGPVEKQVLAYMPNAGGRAKDLVLALARYGLGAPDEKPAPAPGASNGRPTPAPTATAPEPAGPAPSGKFSQDTQEQLRQAVALEAEGRKAYAAASPDNPDPAARMANVRKAYKLLRQVRAIYSTALDEDPSAPGLESRLREISRLVSDLKKTLPPGGE